MRNNTQAKSQKGFTLFEILIGAVIFTILAAVIVPQLTGVKDRNVLVTQEIGLMNTTLGNLEDRFFDEIIDDNNLNNEQLITGQILADSYRTVGTDTIYNLFGGQINVSGQDSNGITWVTAGVTEPACVKLIDDAKRLGFDFFDVVAGNATSGTATTAYEGATNSTYALSCSSAFDGNDVATVTFRRAVN